VKGGAIIFVPPLPRQWSTKPSRGCVDLGAADSPDRRILAPPVPGVRARATADRTVTVSYRFHTLPAACKPVTLLVTLDVNDDGGPGATRDVPIRRSESDVPLGVPSYLRGTPNVIIVSALTADLQRSRTAAVRIRR
jgi:hypothetical protein